MLVLVAGAHASADAHASANASAKSNDNASSNTPCLLLQVAKVVSRRPRSVQEHFFSAQEASKSAQDAHESDFW